MANTGGLFSEMFGHLGAEMCRLGLNGQIAVKTSNGYKTYDIKTGRLTNVGQFAFDIGQELFFVVPTTKANRGDILLVDRRPKCVIENNNNETIKVMDYENSMIQEIVPERHVFLGQTYFYRKIVSMFGNNFLKGEKGFGKMMKLMMFREMLGSSKDSNSGNPMGGMMSMFMMSQMMGNKEFDFGDMFNFDTGLEINEGVESEPEKVKEI